MKVLIDTSVWSLALRRRPRVENEEVVRELAGLVDDGRVVMIGPVRQELLSGLRERAQFERLREHLRAFRDLELTSDDYEEAALAYNRCRSKGIQGSNTDFLICAVAIRRELSIFTTDEDFGTYSRLLPIALHEIAT